MALDRYRGTLAMYAMEIHTEIEMSLPNKNEEVKFERICFALFVSFIMLLALNFFL